jgi:hypothetical protein
MQNVSLNEANMCHIERSRNGSIERSRNGPDYLKMDFDFAQSDRKQIFKTAS